jgi:hypothetical protein
VDSDDSATTDNHTSDWLRGAQFRWMPRIYIEPRFCLRLALDDLTRIMRDKLGVYPVNLGFLGKDFTGQAQSRAIPS